MSLDTIIYGNTLQVWLTSLAIVIATWIVLRLFERVVLHRLHALAKRTSTDWDDLAAHVLGKTSTLFLLVVGVYFGARPLELGNQAPRIIAAVTVVALLVQAGLWANGLIEFWLDRYRKRQEDLSSITTMNALAFMSKVAAWVVVLLLVLGNLGVDITGLLTGVGIGGIAIALAVQKILSDLFASLTIVLDKPFVLGDFLIVDDLMGTVEHIGLKSTRLTSISGEQLVFSNTDLLSSRIRNYGRMQERRAVFTIGVTYDTPRDKLRKLPELLQKAVESQEKTRFDRSHLKTFGDFSINFETMYYIGDSAYKTYMDIQQAVNLAVHRMFEDEGIEFAFPTQTVHLVGATAKPS